MHKHFNMLFSCFFFKKKCDKNITLQSFLWNVSLWSSWAHDVEKPKAWESGGTRGNQDTALETEILLKDLVEIWDTSQN